MGDAWIFIPVLVVAVLLAAPSVRRWFTNDERRPLVDPEQDITVDPVMDQGASWFRHRLNYRSRRMPHGRRHVAPSHPSADRVRRESPPGPDRAGG
jgi:hypothetical protein